MKSPKLPQFIPQKSPISKNSTAFLSIISLFWRPTLGLMQWILLEIRREGEVWGNGYRTTPSFLHLTLGLSKGVGCFLHLKLFFIRIQSVSLLVKNLIPTLKASESSSYIYIHTIKKLFYIHFNDLWRFDYSFNMELVSTLTISKSSNF